MNNQNQEGGFDVMRGKMTPFLSHSFGNLLFAFIVTLLPSVVEAQLLNLPESIVFDETNNRYLVSNYATGDLVEIAADGSQSYFVQGQRAIQGLEIVENVVYVGCDSLVRGFDLTTGELVMDLFIPGVVNLNDVTADNSGNLYVSDVFGTEIIKVRISDQTFWTFATDDIFNPNGIFFDEEHDRILVCSYRPNSPIQAISLEDSSVSTVANTNISYCDGITEDNFGNYYVTSWTTLSIYRYDSGFTDPPELFYTNPDGAADISYNKRDDVLAIPLQISNGVDFVPIEPLVADFNAVPASGHAPQSVQFFDESSGFEPVVEWAWDFNNDGTVDSEVQNPNWIYAEPGVYTVRLEVASSSYNGVAIREEYIHIFDGESSLWFDGHQGQALCEATPLLNLTDGLTLEAWVNPSGWGEASPAGYGRIVDKSNFALYLNGEASLYNDHSLILLLKNETGPPVVSNTPVNSVNLDGWQHVSATYDAEASQVRMYISGIEQVLDQTNTPSGPIRDTSEIDLYVGNSSGGVYTFDGTIDEVRIWDFARSSGAIQSTMLSYLNGSEEGLVAYWQMNEGSGDTIYDGSTNGHDAAAVQIGWREGVDLDQWPADPFSDDTTSMLIHLFDGRPNPFSDTITMTFELPTPAHATLLVHDGSGKLVRSLLSGTFDNGPHTVRWDGLNDEGVQVGSGTYFCTIRTQNTVQTERILFLR